MITNHALFKIITSTLVLMLGNNQYLIAIVLFISIHYLLPRLTTNLCIIQEGSSLPATPIPHLHPRPHTIHSQNTSEYIPVSCPGSLCTGSKKDDHNKWDVYKSDLVRSGEMSAAVLTQNH